MEMNSIFHYNYQTTANGQSVKEEKQTGIRKSDSEQKLLEAAELAEFKRKFYDDLSKIVPYKTSRDTTLIISEAAFREMKKNPEYREKVLALIRRDWGNFCGPRKYKVLITVGADLKDYRASSWPATTVSQSKKRRYIRKKFYKKLQKKRLEKKERMKEYMEDQIMVKRLAQALRNEEAANEMLLRRYRELRECP